MSQIWDIDLIAPSSTSPSVDIQRLIDGFNTIRSMWSGASEPASADQVAYMVWADTTSGLWKQRNAANTGWIVRGTLSEALVLSKSGNYTIALKDRTCLVLCNAAGGAFTITLPDAATAVDGFDLLIKKTDSSVNAVTVDGNGSQTIDGALTYLLTVQNQAARIHSDLANWQLSAAYWPHLGGPDVVTKTASFTIDATHLGKIIDCTSGTFTAAVTAAATLGAKFYCWLKNSGSGVVTLDPNAAETVDGAATLVLESGDACGFICDGLALKTFSKNVTPQYKTMTDGATITPDAQEGPLYTVTLGGNRTLANPTSLQPGQPYVFRIVQDGIGSRTLAFGSAYKFPGGTAPTLSTAASAIDMFAGIAVSTSRIDCGSLLANVS